MLEEVYKWIQNIAVYLVVVTAMLHAVPGKDYERYIRFFSGLVLIVLIFMPVLSVFGMKETFEQSTVIRYMKKKERTGRGRELL